MKTLLESIIGRKGASTITKQILREGEVVEIAAGIFYVFAPKFHYDKYGAFITAVGNFGKFHIAANHTTSWDDNLKAIGSGSTYRQFDVVRVYRKPETGKFPGIDWADPIKLKDYINWIIDNVKPINTNQ